MPNEYILQDTLKSAIAAFGILLAALAWTWDLRRNPRPVKWHWIVFLPMSLCLYAVGSMMWSHAYLAGVEAIRWFLVTTLVWVVANTDSERSTRKLLLAVHYGASVASLWVVLQFVGDFQVFPQGAAPASTFINRNFYAEYAAGTLPLSVYLLLNSRRPSILILLSGTIALVITGLLMSGARSGLLAMFVVLPLCLWAAKSKQLAIVTWPRTLAIGVFGILIVVVLALGNIPSKSHLIGIGKTAFGHSASRATSLVEVQQGLDASFSTRLMMWTATARMFYEHPLFGIGAGAWEVEIPRHQRLYTMLETDYYAHNELLQLLSEYGGIVGGAVAASLLALVLFNLSLSLQKTKATTAPGPTDLYCTLGLLALLLVSNAGFPLHLAAHGCLLGILLGIIAKSSANTSIVGSMPTLFDTASMSLRTVGTAVIIGGLTVTAYISYQAMRAEYLIVKASEQAFLLRQAVAKKQISGIEQEKKKQSILESVRAGIAINPHYRKLTTDVAEQFAAMGDWQHTAEILESVVASRPHVAALWRGLANAYLATSHIEKAELAAQQLLRLRPMHPTSASTEARVLEADGHYPEAMDLLAHSISKGVYDFELLQLGYRLGSDHNNAEFAIRCIEISIEKWPESTVNSSIELGIFLDRIDRVAPALKAFTKAYLASAPGDREKTLKQIPIKYRLAMKNGAL